MTATLKLTNPVRAHGKEVSTLTFRPVTGRELARNGYPFRVVGKGSEVQRITDLGVIAAYISDLASIPPSSVDMLSKDDWFKAMGLVLDFLLETPAEQSS